MTKEIDSAQIAKDVLKREQDDRRALALLLDRYITKRDHLFVQRIRMGGTESYIGSVTLEWLAGRVSFAEQLPLFSQKLDPETKRLIIDNETIDQIRQRPLDWSRQLPLALYLATREPHKFPPVLVAVSRAWVDKKEADEWDRDGKAVRTVTDFTPLDNEGSVGLLNVSEEFQIYALDGQHRLMGTQGLIELIHSGKLARCTKEGKAKGDPITIEDLRDYAPDNFKASKLQTLGSELIGVEFIATVLAGETREEAKHRLRSIFVHVNRMATPLKKGDIAQLEEDNGFAIVARRIAVGHPLLADKRDRPHRVEWHRSELRRDQDEYLTTLQTLKSIAETYLIQKVEFGRWKPKIKGLVPLRPNESELEKGYQELSQFFDHFSLVPAIRKLDQGVSAPKLRAWKKDGGEANLLLRPVGQRALARAVGTLVFQGHRSLDSLFRKLSDFDKHGGLRMDGPETPWYSVLYDWQRKKVVLVGEALASRLFVYLLGGGIADDKEREGLRCDLADARKLPDEDKVWDLNGNKVVRKDFELPPAL